MSLRAPAAATAVSTAAGAAAVFLTMRILLVCVLSGVLYAAAIEEEIVSDLKLERQNQGDSAYGARRPLDYARVLRQTDEWFQTKEDHLGTQNSQSIIPRSSSPKKPRVQFLSIPLEGAFSPRLSGKEDSPAATPRSFRLNLNVPIDLFSQTEKADPIPDSYEGEEKRKPGVPGFSFPLLLSSPKKSTESQGGRKTDHDSSEAKLHLGISASTVAKLSDYGKLASLVAGSPYIQNRYIEPTQQLLGSAQAELKPRKNYAETIAKQMAQNPESRRPTLTKDENKHDHVVTRRKPSVDEGSQSWRFPHQIAQAVPLMQTWSTQKMDESKRRDEKYPKVDWPNRPHTSDPREGQGGPSYPPVSGQQQERSSQPPYLHSSNYKPSSVQSQDSGFSWSTQSLSQTHNQKPTAHIQRYTKPVGQTSTQTGLEWPTSNPKYEKPHTNFQTGVGSSTRPLASVTHVSVQQQEVPSQNTYPYSPNYKPSGIQTQSSGLSWSTSSRVQSQTQTPTRPIHRNSKLQSSSGTRSEWPTSHPTQEEPDTTSQTEQRWSVPTLGVERQIYQRQPFGFETKPENKPTTPTWYTGQHSGTRQGYPDGTTTGSHAGYEKPAVDRRVPFIQRPSYPTYKSLTTDTGSMREGATAEHDPDPAPEAVPGQQHGSQGLYNSQSQRFPVNYYQGESKPSTSDSRVAEVVNYGSAYVPDTSGTPSWYSAVATSGYEAEKSPHEQEPVIPEGQSRYGHISQTDYVAEKEPPKQDHNGPDGDPSGKFATVTINFGSGHAGTGEQSHPESKPSHEWRWQTGTPSNTGLVNLKAVVSLDKETLADLLKSRFQSKRSPSSPTQVQSGCTGSMDECSQSPGFGFSEQVGYSPRAEVSVTIPNGPQQQQQQQQFFRPRAHHL